MSQIAKIAWDKMYTEKKKVHCGESFYSLGKYSAGPPCQFIVTVFGQIINCKYYSFNLVDFYIFHSSIKGGHFLPRACA